jgi:hypothetical protein
VPNNYFDNTVTNGVEYFYGITAVDDSGNESALSAIASATPTAPPLSFATFSLDDIAEGSTNLDADITATTNTSAYIRPLFWENGSAPADTSGSPAWVSPAATDHGGTYDTGIVIAALGDSTARVTWEAPSSGNQTGYRLQGRVDTGAGFGSWTTITHQHPDSLGFTHVASDDTLAVSAGKWDYRLYAYIGVPGAETETSEVAVLPSFLLNNCTMVNTEFHALDDWGGTPVASSRDSLLWMYLAEVPADTTPPDTTGVFAGVAVDTTNASDVLLTLSNMTITGDPSQVQFEWSNDGGSTYYGDSSWSPVTASTTVGDTIETGIATGAINGDLWTRFRLRDDEGTPNVSEWNENEQEFVRAAEATTDTVGYGSIGSTSSDIGSYLYAAKIVMPEDGTINSATIYLDPSQDEINIKVAIMSATFATSDSVRTCDNFQIFTGDVSGWYTFEFSTPYSASNGEAISVACFSDVTCYVFRTDESAGTLISASSNQTNYASFCGDDEVTLSSTYNNRRYSMFITYTPE